jgi:hypothetical protein
MNRRGFFSFLPGAAVGVAAAATVKAEAKPAIPPEVVRYDNSGIRCPNCDSPCFHMKPTYNRFIAYGGETFLVKVGESPACFWCGEEWKGAMPA